MMSLRRFIWPIASLSKPYLTNTYSVPKTFNSFATFTHNLVKSKFPKQHRGTIKGISSQGNHISFGRYALQALEPAWITSRQIEAGRKTIIRNARPGGKMGKIWVRIFPDKSITLKPGEVRMGRGKGSPAYCVAVVKPGRILYEIDGVTESIARKAISIASTKIPVRTKFIISG